MPASGFNAPPPPVLPSQFPGAVPGRQQQPQEEMDRSFIGMSGGDIVHEMLRKHDVKHVFGYPGGAVLPVYDAIYNSPHFEFILPRAEQGAGHSACRLISCREVSPTDRVNHHPQWPRDTLE